MDGCPFRFAFEYWFNSPANVLAQQWKIASSAANCLKVDTIWFDLMQIRKKREHKIYLCGAPKKTKQNKIKRWNSYTNFISFLAEVVNILHRI